MEFDEPSPIEELRDYIAREVAAGLQSPADILEAAHAMFEDAIPFTDRQLRAYALLRDALRAHAAAQVAWPPVTDCDRLDAAFAALERSGILARQHYWCCQTCGAAAIWEEVDAAGDAARGFVFYHEQDTDNAVEGYGLYLAYGAVGEDDEATVAIGDEITAALAAQGLRPEWDRDTAKRIFLPLLWQRRRDDCDWAREH